MVHVCVFEMCMNGTGRLLRPDVLLMNKHAIFITTHLQNVSVADVRPQSSIE